jgi:Zn finger protein HypA/HybF involved in hydrogenase expression
MHEVGLISDALERAIATARRAGATRIQRLTFALPTGGHVTADTLQMLVPVLSKGTLAEGAAVSIDWQPRCFKCLGCGQQAARGPDCARCGAPLVSDADLPDLVLASIEVDC